MAVKETRILTLNDGEHKQSILHRLKKGWRLRLVLGPSLMGRQVKVFTNHVEDKHRTGINQAEYWELEFQQESKAKNDDLDKFAEITCTNAGPFHYFFLCDTDSMTRPSGSGYFQVEPTLKVRHGRDEEVLPLDCIQCCTHVSKLLGPLDQWEGRLAVAKESGYNMIHLTPVQELGISNSSYCLANQIKLNSEFGDYGEEGMGELKKLVEKLKNDWGMLTLCDVVWNHTAKNSPWLKDHPEASYNLANSPHLRPAYLFDRALHIFGREIGEGKWEDRGIPPGINSEHHLHALRHALNTEIIPPLKLETFFQVDTETLKKEFKAILESDQGCKESQSFDDEDRQLRIIQDDNYKRLGSTVDLKLAAWILKGKNTNRAIEELGHMLNDLNDKAARETAADMETAVNAILGHVTYERVAAHGKKLPKVQPNAPLLTDYFMHYDGEYEGSMEKEEKMMYESKRNKYIMAFNGWVMCDNPLRNFAEAPSKVYLRRELVCWGDCVKLNFGERKEDSPFLWDFMTQYARISAEVFHGVRLDNCHSTPLHVAEYLLERAREVRPELYVVAELFTGSEELDNLFVNKLGITSLIREAMNAHDSHEEGRLVYKYGGHPVGAFIQRPMRPIAPCIAHACFMDQTHDNKSPIEVRTVYDLFPSAGLVSMACCATGSTRGYDELVPFHIDVVTEARRYSTWDSGAVARNSDLHFINSEEGIIAGKRLLNDLHQSIGNEGYTQVYVDQVNPDVVAVTRHNPKSHKGVVMIARTKFNEAHGSSHIRSLIIDGEMEEILFEGVLQDDPEKSADPSDKFIKGLSNYSMKTEQHVAINKSNYVEIHAKSKDGNPIQEICFTNFPPSAVVAFRVNLSNVAKEKVRALRRCLSQFGYVQRTLSGRGTAALGEQDMTIGAILDRMSLADLNRVLFRTGGEERDEGKGGDTYDFPRFGRPFFTGLQGLVPILDEIRLKNDLGHPVCGNIRDGDWLANYIVHRLKQNPGTHELGEWFDLVFGDLSGVPHFLKPSYFDAIVDGSFSVAEEAVWSKMSQFVIDGSEFLRALALASVAFCGYSKTGRLPELSSNVAKPRPLVKKNEETGMDEQLLTSISAGLPHFATGLFRNWGRDTFIALPGCMLVTGRFDEARYVILSFTGTLRHGLIPNLLGEGVCARYNCRDAVWFWLYAIRTYCELAPNGDDILKDKVRRLYPTDDAETGANEKEETLTDTMQEALNRHFQGIEYRERNAGHSIDEHMKDEGFNVSARVDLETGLIFGGNRWNCGTWMDKMGSSEKAGTRGSPATPRNGAAVELQGLCYSVVDWLNGMSEAGKYPKDGVERVQDYHGAAMKWSWGEWRDKLRKSFPECFYIPESIKTDSNAGRNDVKLVNKVGIVKDCYEADPSFQDYQLRPNFGITLAVAPELLPSDLAWKALCVGEKKLVSTLGIRTLDPDDWNYAGDYNNDDDSHDAMKAKGFNYHNGPEWVWVMGYFLKAKLTVANRIQKELGGTIWADTVAHTKKILANHWVHLQNSPWRSLPELTNKDGSFCGGSCPAQAWSVGCILEVLHDLDRLEE